MFFPVKQVFTRNYHVIVNLDTTAKSNIGIVTLINNEINIGDIKIWKSGRINAVKIIDVQILQKKMELHQN